MLVLPIKKKWFDMLQSGEKKEEYREIKPYYKNRLEKYFTTWEYTPDGLQNVIIFRNGYSKNSPQIKCLCTMSIGKGKEEWRSRKRQKILCIKNFKSI